MEAKGCETCLAQLCETPVTKLQVSCFCFTLSVRYTTPGCLPFPRPAEEQVVRPSTPATEHGAYALVVAIRFLERSAFDTLARLVDPRGGYILLSTFIEEETEITPPGATQSGEGRGCLRGSAGGDFGGSAGKEERSLGDVFTSPVAGAAAGRSKGRGGNKASVPRADREGGQQGERVGMSTDADTGAATGDTTSTVGTPITTAMPLASSSSSLWSEEEWGIASPGEQSGNLLAEHRRPDVDSSNSSVNRENSEARTENTYPTGKIQKRKPGSKPAARKRKPGSAAAALEAAAAAATMARWPHASPRDPKKILRRGELARYFGGRHGFEVLEDSVERLPDGRPVACFLARKVRSQGGDVSAFVVRRGGRGGAVRLLGLCVDRW